MFSKDGFENGLKKILHKIPYVRKLHAELHSLKSGMYYPSGHFYSPIVSWKEVKDVDTWVEKDHQEILDVDFNECEQLDLIKSFINYYSEIPWQAEQQEALRYFFNNDYYSYTDGLFLYSIMRKFKPRRIIEIGSGFSSALMVDTNELFLENKVELVFIEPYPDRLYSLLHNDDLNRVTIKKQKVQNVSIEEFEKLKQGDILFIDSSHVSKTGSDVNDILFRILPKLKKGVLIHFHDIFYPFEYPKLWIYQGRNWNENYFLRAFLMGNKKFKVLLFADYLHRFKSEMFGQMPLLKKNTGGNLWLEKLVD